MYYRTFQRLLNLTGSFAENKNITKANRLQTEDKVKIIHGTESQLIQTTPGFNAFLNGAFLGQDIPKQNEDGAVATPHLQKYSSVQLLRTAKPQGLP